MTSASATLERGLDRLDGLRRSTFSRVLRARVLSGLVVRRDTRLALFASMHAAVAFVASIYYPVLLFVLVPVLLGVAHVAADLRYLVLRRRLGRWWQRVVIAACAAFVLLAVFGRLGWVRWSERAEFGLLAAWAMTGVVAGSLRSRAWGRSAVGLSLVLAMTLVALSFPRAFRLAYLHGHNLVALAVWPLFFRARLGRLSLLRLPILAAAALLASGFAYRTSLASPGSRQYGLHVLELADWVAPVLRADWAIGVTSAFVFLQAVHYSIWLSVIPQAAVPGQGTLSFRQTARSLRADFGGVGLLLVLGCVLAVVLFGTLDVRRASSTYMTLALFHGYLELVLLLYFWVAREPLAQAASVRRSPR